MIERERRTAIKKFVYNYSSVMKREGRIYSLGLAYIPGGISVKFVKVVAPIFLGILLLGFLLSFPLGINMLNPLAANLSLWYLFTWVGIGFIAAWALWGIPLGGYRLYEYVLARMRVKHVISATSRLKDKKNFSNYIWRSTFINRL